MNIISSQTLLIYVIHDNLLIREFLRSKWFKYVYNMFGYEYIILICTISAICTLILSIIISYIYQKSIQPILHKFVDKMYGYIEKYISKFEKEEMYEK